MPTSPTESEQHRAQLRAQIDAVDIWYHDIDFGDGLRSGGHFRMERWVEHYPFPESLEGKRALDVGCSNGWFSLHFERLGAYEVVGIDLPGWAAHDWSERYLHQYRTKSQEERSGIDRAVFGTAFDLVKRELSNGAMKRHETRVYDMDAEVLGRFDFVFCGAALMHMRDPLLALVKMRELAAPGAELVVSTSITPDLRDAGPVARFVGEWELCNFWQISPAALSRMLAFAGWVETGPTSYYDQVTEGGEFTDNLHVTRAVAMDHATGGVWGG